MFFCIILLLPIISYCSQMYDLNTLRVGRRYTFYDIPKPTPPGLHMDNDLHNQPLNPLTTEEQKLQSLKLIVHDYLREVVNITGTEFANEKVKLGRNQGSFKLDVDEPPFYVNILITWTPPPVNATTTTTRPI